MDDDEKIELQSLLLTFRAHREPGKLTPTKGSQRSPRLSRSSASAAAYSPGHSITPLPSPLSAYAPSAAQSDDPDVSEQTAALIAQPVQLSKEEQAEAIVLSLIQDRATGVDWDCEPHASNLGSLFRLEHEEAVEMLGVWYPCINEKRLSRAVERYRCKAQKEEDEEMKVKITDVRSKIGTSFDSAILLDSGEEMGDAHYKTGQSFDSAIVVDDEDEGNGKIQNLPEEERYGESLPVKLSMLLTNHFSSVEEVEVTLPARLRIPSPPAAPITFSSPKTPINVPANKQLLTPCTPLTSKLQHSGTYSPPTTPTRRPNHGLYLTGNPSRREVTMFLKTTLKLSQEPRNFPQSSKGQR